MLQERLIYFPAGDPGPPPASWESLEVASTDGVDLTVWVRFDATATGRPVVIVFPGNAGNRAGLQVAAIHDRRIHLDPAEFVEDGATAGIEQWVVLQLRGAGLHRLQGGAPQFHHLPAMFEDAADAFQVTDRGLLILDIIQCTGPAVDHERVRACLVHERVFCLKKGGRPP